MRTKKKKCYIIEKFNFMGNAYTSLRLLQEGIAAGFETRLVGVCDTVCSADGLINKTCLGKADLVVNRFKYGNLKDKLAALGKISVNNIKKINKYYDKSQQLDITSDHMSHPKTILAFAGFPFEALVQTLGLPFVAKGLYSSQGDDVHLVKDFDDYVYIHAKYRGQELLFQQFIATSKGRDVRLLSVRGEVVGCMERESTSGFKANFAKGANVKNYPVGYELKKIAEDIYEQTQTDVLGIDLLYGKDGYVFCEINVTPGIEGIEKACGCNAAAAIIALGNAK